MELSSYYNENNGTLENTSPRKPYLNGSTTVISSSSQASAEQHKKILRYIIYFFILK